MINDLVKIIKQGEENGFNLYNFCMSHDILCTGLYNGIIKQLLSKNLVDLLLLNKEFNKCYWGRKTQEDKQKIKNLWLNNALSREQYYMIKFDIWEQHLQVLVLKDNKVVYFKRGLKNETL